MSIFIILFILLSVIIYIIFRKYTIKPNIIVTLTTSPKRINNIEPVINSINKQTVPPNLIYINLPYVYKRTGETFSAIPNFLIKPNIIINYVEDIGPATKIIPILKQSLNMNSLIISIDDDILYGNNMIETILYYHKLYPNKVLTSSSFIHKKEYYNPPRKDSGIVAGFSGVAYPYKIIKEKHIDKQLEQELLTIPDYCYFSDDFVISNILLNNNIDILLLGHSNRQAYYIEPLKYGLQEDALHKGGAINNYNNKVNNSDIHIDNYIKCAKYYYDKNKLNKKLYAFLK